LTLSIPLDHKKNNMQTHINGKQITRATFEQLPEGTAVSDQKGIHNSKLLGTVHYETEDASVWALYSRKGVLYKEGLDLEGAKAQANRTRRILGNLTGDEAYVKIVMHNAFDSLATIEKLIKLHQVQLV